MEPTDEHLLQRWVDDARTTEAARRRRRIGSWQTHGADGATLAGVLDDLADLPTEVTITLISGRRHRGVIDAIHGPWSVLGTGDGHRIGIHSRAIAAIDCLDLRPAFGDRSDHDPASGPTGTGGHGTARIIEALVDPTRPITLWSATLMTHGELRSLSTEIAVVITGIGVRHVPLDAVEEVVGNSRF